MTDNTQPWRELVQQALRDHRYNEVVVRLKTILTEHPDSAQAWVFLGEALEHQKHRASAWRCFERAGILDPLAVWLPSVSQRLQTAHGAIPAWLNRLLTPPTVHVIGAILAKNESDNITRCIAALQPAVDEVLVIDTGSTDDTVALASPYAHVLQSSAGRARQLNKGESLHALRRDLCYAHEGAVRHRHHEDQSEQRTPEPSGRRRGCAPDARSRRTPPSTWSGHSTFATSSISPWPRSPPRPASPEPRSTGTSSKWTTALRAPDDSRPHRRTARRAPPEDGAAQTGVAAAEAGPRSTCSP